jgi:hypothetical protein
MKVKRLKKFTRKRRTIRKKVYNGGDRSQIPIFIICWNQYTYVKSIVEQLQKYPNIKIYIIDNKSTYKPLVDYLKIIDGKNGIEVLYQPENYGHKVYERPDIYERGGDMYIVTDPDLRLNTKMPANFREIMAKISEAHKANKVGLALDITNNRFLQILPELPTSLTQILLQNDCIKLTQQQYDLIINTEYNIVGDNNNIDI